MRGRIQEADQSAPIRRGSAAHSGGRPQKWSGQIWPWACRSRDFCSHGARSAVLRAVSTRVCSPVTAARRFKNYFYYTRTLEGAQYAVHCRRALPPGVPPPSEADVMDDSISGGYNCDATAIGDVQTGIICRLHAWLAGSLQSRRLWTEQPHVCMPHLPCCASPVLLGESMEARCCCYSHTPTC